MKATRSGEVVGQAMTGFSSSAANDQGSVTVFINPGYQVINNTFVLGPDDGQLTGAIGGGAPTSSADSAFLINQNGSSNILQVQQNGMDKFVIANDDPSTL